MRHDLADEILHSHAAIHDRSQFEVKFTYDVSAGKGKDVERYRIEAFHFFPTNMGITALTFPKEDFYRSLHGYIRFKTPELQPFALLDPLNRQSPLNMLSFHLKRLTMGQGEADNAHAANEARLFGCIVSSWFKTQQHELLHLLSRAKRRAHDAGRWAELDGYLSDMLNTSLALLGKYRALVHDYHMLAMSLDRQFLDRLKQVDEFLTYRFDEAVTGMHFQLASVWEAPERLHRLQARLREVAEGEARHRHAQGFVAISPADEPSLALYTYRASALKKLVERVLYLEVHTVQETNRWRNLAAGMGAMVAAVFASYGDRTVVFPLAPQNLWLAISIFALLYVAKDRMKEFLREYVWTRIARYFPDNRLLLHDPVKHIDIGRCWERVHYRNKSAVRPDVLRVRNFNHAIDLDEEREETVIVYQNDVTLRAREILAEHQRRTHIKHILRFSVEDLLARMDNPTVGVGFFDPLSQAFCQLKAPKVYHLNVVFRFTRWDEHGAKGEPHYQRIRVILDKNGIQRIESVVEACRLAELSLPGAERRPAPAPTEELTG